MPDKTSILCTYELPQNCNLEVEKGLDLDIIPLISLEPAISKEDLTLLGALPAQPLPFICTSANTVAALQAYHIIPNSYWHFYCLENTTKQAILKAWPSAHIAGTAIDAQQLANLIITDQLKVVYYLCSEIRLDLLPKTLTESQILLHEIICYRNVAQPITFEKTYDVLLFCSPSAVNAYALNNEFQAEQHLFAIGNTTARALNNYTQQPIHVASIPDKRVLLQEAITYIKTKKSEFKKRPIT